MRKASLSTSGLHGKVVVPLGFLLCVVDPFCAMLYREVIIIMCVAPNYCDLYCSCNYSVVVLVLPGTMR